jgi:hypothetical protein
MKMPRCSHESYKFNIIDKEEPNYYSREISTFYNYDGDNSTYIFFISDRRNIYIETKYGSIIIPYCDIQKYNKLYIYYIISLQLTAEQSKIYYCKIGYKGVYKEKRYWYILTNISWKYACLSYGDYCYFKESPTTVNINTCSPIDTINNYIILFNNIEQNPYKISYWLINYEIDKISSILYDNEETINRAKQVKDMLEIITKHFNINDDIKIKILYQYYQLYII